MDTSEQQPEFLSQGIDYLGFLAQQLGDLHGITTLAHELIQNADDAKNESGELAATTMVFDVRDDALVVWNDALFRDEDFQRMRNIASGAKRFEHGARTTGAFGVGFITVYQVTDRPEILSAGRHWILQPEEREDRRITQYRDPSIAMQEGTTFILPWAFEKSEVRDKLRTPPVTKENLATFTDELAGALSPAIVFLKKLETVELRRNGKRITAIRRIPDGDDILVDCDGSTRVWRIIRGNFNAEARRLRDHYRGYIDDKRLDEVRVAIPDAAMDGGLLFATLPTQEKTGLPFHVDADFFPDSDRKHIVFSSETDYRSEWNRAAIRAAAISIAQNLIIIRKIFANDPCQLWSILERIYHIQQDGSGDARKPMGAFWEEVSTVLRTAPIVYTESGEWKTPAEVRLVTGPQESEAVPALTELRMQIVHRDLGRYRNILAGYAGVQPIKAQDIHVALAKRKMVGQPATLDMLPPGLQTGDAVQRLRRGIHGVLENTRSQTEHHEASTLLGNCALAPATDGQLRPFRTVHKADKPTVELFSALLPGVFFVLDEGEPLLDKLCLPFLADSAVKELLRFTPDHFRSLWKAGRFDPAKLLEWFDDNKKELEAHPQLRRHDEIDGAIMSLCRGMMV